VIDPEITVSANGTIDVPSRPGIGVQIVNDRVARATEAILELRA
jgi:L-alanine-DL-glutamate epimerase-like enolase superfamily enzyme